ncbi:MAG: 16S rRNA (cytosine(1402)-N(4))-methyltransferase RsmH [Clostridia bacterium]|jgi:16S rRNA (cytosine1402-N4)-methyltransferase|nr:16S rRNA (cytosine(1402)-N(4))-methyltransferase RsmH [Clostridia bacterium]
MKEATFSHVPVMLEEVLTYLHPQPGQLMIDCTAGGGGHSKALLKKLLPGGQLIALDQDKDAVMAAKQALEPLGAENFTVIRTNFTHLQESVRTVTDRFADGILFDLGVSSYQLDNIKRGFSYQQDAPLDMRMDTTAGFSAADLLNRASAEELTRIIAEYGEERWAKRIAQFIVEERSREPLATTGQLVEIIKKAVPKGARREGPHPAKRTFQAIRIAVNRELEILDEAMEQAVSILRPGGRLAVITFHSLEDRMIKEFFRKQAQGCTCPKEFPVCVCNNKPAVKIVTAKPVLPTEREVESNPRSRSAKLRVVEKTPLF